MKKRWKKYIPDSYEAELKISLVLLVGFLLSLNVISAYSLNRARVALQASFQSRVRLSASLIQNIIDHNYGRPPEVFILNEILTLSGVDAVEIYDSVGNCLAQAASARGTNQDLPIAHSAAIRNKDGSIVYHVLLRGADPAVVELNRLALFDLLFRIAGLLAGLLVAYLFIRSVMNPYRRIRKEASELNLPRVDFENAGGVEYAVRVFHEVIRQLKEKESLLQSMYVDSEKRADSLARYNEYILGSISSGVVICDNFGIITRFNPAAERILGLDHVQSHGKGYIEVFGRKHRLSRIITEALERSITFSREEFEIVDKSGETKWIGLSSSLIFDSAPPLAGSASGRNAGNKIGAAVLLTDLTRIKKLQDISDFTEKMAALGEMSAGLAHELRNSITAIIGFGKLVSKTLPAESSASPIVKSIIAESLATEEMLSRFLDFARPLRVTPAWVNLKELVERSVAITEEALLGKKVSIKIEDRTGGVEIVADMILMRKVFDNLILNAYQAMEDKGSIKISIDQDAPAKRVVVVVHDDGKGIAQSDLPKIFNPFFTTKERGTGLGLALARKIVAAHMGSIEVESEVGKGTTFIISVPLDYLHEDAAEPAVMELAQA